MSDSLNNKELVAVGHQFAKALSSDTALMDIAKMLTRLAERLDFTTAALHETQKQRDQLGAENAALKKAEPAPFSKLMMEALDAYQSGADEVPELAMLSAYTKLRDGIKTPASDAFLAEAARATVTLPTGYSVRPGHPINETERSVMIPKDGGPWLSRFDVEHALRVAGISIKGE